MRGAKWVQQARLFSLPGFCTPDGLGNPSGLSASRERKTQPKLRLKLSLSGGKATRWPLLDGKPEAGTSKAQDPGKPSQHQHPALEPGAFGAGRRPDTRMIPGSCRAGWTVLRGHSLGSNFRAAFALSHSLGAQEQSSHPARAGVPEPGMPGNPPAVTRIRG